MKKKLFMHDESSTRHNVDDKVHEGALPAYLLDRDETTHTNVLSNTLKQKRKERAEKWEVHLPKEARTLLGRLEYQMGNYEMVLQVIQGIDISGLRMKMVSAIVEISRPKRPYSLVEIVRVNVTSMYLVSLLLEAMLMKLKFLAELGRTKDAAMECMIILEIIKPAWPNAMSKGVQDESKLEEIFHNALELLPKLWKKAGLLGEAISVYRRVLIIPWNLDLISVLAFRSLGSHSTL